LGDPAAGERFDRLRRYGWSGEWDVVGGKAACFQPGLLIYVMVEDAEATVKLIVANGCDIVQAIGGDAPEITARFRDPGGNVMGIYQEPVKTQS
jgi:predicted enzyme related to lactoylglutathione lyase